MEETPLPAEVVDSLPEHLRPLVTTDPEQAWLSFAAYGVSVLWVPHDRTPDS